MATGTTKAPNLPLAPMEYSQQFQDQLNNVLRLYFAQLDSPTISAAAGLVLDVDRLPTQADVATIRAGTVYRDSTAGNVLKVKV
jgi:hypothetical protein